MWGWAASAPISFTPRAKSQASGGGDRRSSSSTLLASRLPVRPSLLSSSSSLLRVRSRSPRRDGLPGLRSDAPSRRPRVGAQLPSVLSDEDKQQALKELEKDILAATTNKSHASRLRTIGMALSLWGLSPWPPTLTTWKALASTLKKGGYSSAHLYLSAYRTESERRGYTLSAPLIRNVVDFTRSCLRGVGAPSRPKALPLELLHRLPRDREPWVSQGPVNPRAAILCGSWWLCRELELSSQRARLLEFELVEVEGGGRKRWKASLHLPASKTDLVAAGVCRTLLCSCSSSSSLISPACVVHVLLDHVLHLRGRFGHLWGADGPIWELPLFPDVQGEVVSKHAMVETIRYAAGRLGVSECSPDGSERVTGHSLRVSGAQGLAQRGWHLWRIQLHGRWGSDVVKRYIRDSPLQTGASSSQASGSEAWDLEAVVAAVVGKLGSMGVPAELGVSETRGR